MIMLSIAQRSLLAARTTGVRALSTSAVARKDLVQELYLKTLKSFEPPKQDPNAHKGAVREFVQPEPPKQTPSVVGAELDKAFEDFKAYDPEDVPRNARDEEAVYETETVERYLAELQKDPHLEQKEHH
ncbi:hypothetical protein MBRA1_003914 [Malassezia brasiliensis]|uniref:Uncharacterized protein n=1 Tax=Malassezia brasiliensis TaxID=1821822 RepID=A0AAF0IUT0_9BASI|nr:hypothetical protein MBRA1_003914 [Malassezia brasiliensis]